MSQNQIPEFSAPLWLKTGHQQTLYAAMIWSPTLLRADQRIKIPIEDGNHLLCDWNLADRQPQKKLLILVHGLEGCSEAKYILSSAHKALDQGIDTLRVNIRSCGGSIYLNQTLYHAGLSQDLAAVIDYAQQQLKYSQIVLAGFSLGGHQALKLASEWQQSPDGVLKGVCAVSPPLELDKASVSLMRWQNRVYERYFYKSMRQNFRRRRRWWPETPLSTLNQVKHLVDFDNLITAPSFGFRDAADYYQQSSVYSKLGQIQIPTQIIIAMDDPIIPFSSHQQAIQKYPQIRWLVTREGGHVAFCNQRRLAQKDRDQWWAGNRLLDFSQSVLKAAN